MWSATDPTPLFNVGDERGSIQETDRLRLMRNTEYWLAVNGIKDAQVVQGAEAADTAATPSIPSMDGGSAGNGHSADIGNQLQQMLKQGQTPSPEELRKLVGI